MRNSFRAAASYLLFGMLMGFSLLPLRLLYIISDGLALVLFYVVRYRRGVVSRNIRSGPFSSEFLRHYERRFYRHLSDTFVESVKCFTISRRNLLRRIVLKNPELMEEYALQKRSIIVMGSHYGNWELIIYAMNMWFPHLAIGVGKPLSNPTMNQLINARRSRFGMKIIHAQNIKEEFNKDKEILTASLFLSDQYPGHGKRGYHTRFLNNPTDFLFGAEKYARDFNYPVVYADVRRLKRGRYSVELQSISTQPITEESGNIMKVYVGFLEQTILRDPPFWLWSHKRWKQIPGFYGQ